MTQRTDAYIILRRFWLRSLLQSLSCIGVVSLFSSNLVLAQTQIPDAVVVPTKIESKPPAAAAPVVSASDIPRIAPAPPRGVIRQKRSPTLVPVRRERSASRLSVPKVRAVAQPLRNLPKTVQAQPTRNSKKAATNSTANYNGAYIDPTEYRIGATRSYEAPSSVVLSERSTGCRAVLRQGQGLAGSLCGTAQQRRTRVAIRPINTVRSRSQAPNSWVRGIAISGISPVRVAPISSSSNRFRANKRTFSQGQLASGSAVRTRSMFYYNRTPRPAGVFDRASTGLMFPLTIPAPITSLFGWRIHPITGNRRFHSGTDLGASLGTPVLAADAGNVAIADFLGGYGLSVVLEHKKFTQQTLYGHLSEIFVHPGEWVKQGAVIGRVGSTGNSTGPHLHFETRQLTPEGWVATDPGVQLEAALAKLVESLRVAQSSQKPDT